VTRVNVKGTQQCRQWFAQIAVRSSQQVAPGATGGFGDRLSARRDAIVSPSTLSKSSWHPSLVWPPRWGDNVGVRAVRSLEPNGFMAFRLTRVGVVDFRSLRVISTHEIDSSSVRRVRISRLGRLWNKLSQRARRTAG